MTAALLCADSLHAIIVYGSEGGNTSAPTGEYAGSGWQYQGEFGSYLGTVISPTQFITAAHFGSAPTFVYDSISYSVNTTPGSYTNIAGTDLVIYQISGDATFATWAQLYSDPLAAGMELVTMGRGAARGDAVYVDGVLKGWQAGSTDLVQRWGTNTISDIVLNDPNYGNLIVATFDAPSIDDMDQDNEAYFSVFDSGGGVFVKDPVDGVWKLAGVNLGDSGEFATLPDGSDAARGAYFDMGGLYYQTSGGWEQYPDADDDAPAAIFMSSVAGNIDAIRVVVPVPEPGSMLLLAAAGLLMVGRRRR